MLISSCVQAFLGIPLHAAPVRRRGESDNVATSAVYPGQAGHLRSKAVSIGPTSPRAARLDSRFDLRLAHESVRAARGEPVMSGRGVSFT